MDWTKAKTILIVALVVTNLVLLATYFFQNDSFETDDKELQAATIKLLEEKNIFVQTDIPGEHPRMARLTVRYDKMNEDVIREELAAQKTLEISAMTEENLVSMTSDFIEKCGLMTENVTYDSLEQTEGGFRITYKNYLGDIAIEDSYIICTVEGGKITEFKRYWLNPVDDGNNIDREVIPALAALIKFMSENTEQERIDVEDISLVYWLDSSVFDTESPVTDTALPAWKITYNQGKFKYIMAWEQ